MIAELVATMYFVSDKYRYNKAIHTKWGEKYMLNKEDIQRKLQCSDLEVARNLRKKIEDGDKNNEIFAKIKNKYMDPLTKNIKDEKINDFPALLKKLFSTEDIKKIIGIKLSKKEINEIAKDMIRYIDGYNKEYEYLKIEPKSYSNVLQKLRDQVVEKLNDYQNLAGIKAQAPQKTMMLLFPIPSAEIAYILLKVIMELDLSSKVYDFDDEEESAQNTLAKVARKLSETIAVQKQLIENEANHLKQNEFVELLQDLTKKVVPDDIILKTGFSMISLLGSAGITKRIDSGEYGNAQILISFEEDIEEDIEEIKEKIIEDHSLHFDPMVVEPRKWENVLSGGFLPQTSPKYDLPIRKTFTLEEKKQLQEDANEFPKHIYDAINTIQSVPFSINERVYDFQTEELKRIEAEYKNECKKQKAKEPYSKKINKLKEQKKNLSFKLEVINRLKAQGIKLDDPIYFVWQMDFRGRIYPVQSHLNPQGDDEARGLLRFHHAKKIDQSSLRWFRIHGANLYGKDGLDKKPYDEREAWVNENEADIIATDKDPGNSQLLKEADDPYQFLAFCNEYANYLLDPDNFQSRLPIGIDGSNNGLQHISALHKDKESALLVNVLPSDTNKPEDIYAAVAEKTLEKIKADKEKFDKDKSDKSEYIFHNGLYYIEKDEAEPLIENFLTDDMLEAIINNLEKIYTIKTKKKRSKEISQCIEPHITEKIKSMKKKLEEFFFKKCEEAEWDSKKLKNAYKKHLKEFGNEPQFKNEKGQAIEKVVSPHNFIDDKLLDSVDRNFTKANVMTDSYGATLNTKQNQIFKKLKILIDEGKLDELEDRHLGILSRYIGKLNDKSLDEISKASESYMKWMKQCIDTVYKKSENKKEPIRWTTPLGLRVTQHKYETDEVEITTPFGKDRVSMTYQKNKEEINKAKQRSGLAPNFIHSLDATHLFMSILAANERGVESFMTIHDSFGTHAADVEKLLEALKEQFIALHSNNILDKLKKEFEARYEIVLDDIKYFDKYFEIEKVEKSDYFFS